METYEYLDALREIIQEATGIDGDRVQLSTTLTGLGIDDVSFVEVGSAVESHFGVALPDFHEDATIQEIIDALIKANS